MSRVESPDFTCGNFIESRYVLQYRAEWSDDKWLIYDDDYLSMDAVMVDVRRFRGKTSWHGVEYRVFERTVVSLWNPVEVPQ